MLSIIVPAFNEEKCLPAALEAIRAAMEPVASSEVIVVDNGSSDRTREIAGRFGAKLVDEAVHNIARVRNTGAASAVGDVLVFIDADTLVPSGLFKRIAELSADERCLGGSADLQYDPPCRQRWTRYYLSVCQSVGRALKWRQGATQFCRADTFREMAGYDESIFVGEDVEFQWRLAKLAARSGGHVKFIDDLFVTTSPRRFDQFGLIRTLFYTHPAVVFLGWRMRLLWKHWYERAIR
jgi:glycosyltransferase involved in cell wall biosynthesis